jgi:hypothetical protein
MSDVIIIIITASDIIGNNRGVCHDRIHINRHLRSVNSHIFGRDRINVVYVFSDNDRGVFRGKRIFGAAATAADTAAAAASGCLLRSHRRLKHGFEVGVITTTLHGSSGRFHVVTEACPCSPAAAGVVSTFTANSHHIFSRDHANNIFCAVSGNGHRVFRSNCIFSRYVFGRGGSHIFSRNDTNVLGAITGNAPCREISRHLLKPKSQTFSRDDTNTFYATGGSDHGVFHGSHTSSRHIFSRGCSHIFSREGERRVHIVSGRGGR